MNTDLIKYTEKFHVLLVKVCLVNNGVVSE